MAQRIATWPGLGPVAAGDDANRLVVLRGTSTDPCLLDAGNGIRHVDCDFDFLAARLRGLLAPARVG